MPWSNNHLPKYRKHRSSGQAVVTLNGRDFYLGPHGTKASKIQYDRTATNTITIIDNRRRLISEHNVILSNQAMCRSIAVKLQR